MSTMGRHACGVYLYGMANITEGSRTLKAWLDRQDMSRVEFAGLCSVTRQTLYKWFDGTVRPGMAHQHRIAHLTNDTVRVSDWLTSEERVDVTR